MGPQKDTTCFFDHILRVLLEGATEGPMEVPIGRLYGGSHWSALLEGPMEGPIGGPYGQMLHHINKREQENQADFLDQCGLLYKCHHFLEVHKTNHKPSIAKTYFEALQTKNKDSINRPSIRCDNSLLYCSYSTS